MKPDQIQKKQIEKWLLLTAEMTERISEKQEEEIELKDIVKIIQKIQDIINVLQGKSKIIGWRF